MTLKLRPGMPEDAKPCGAIVYHAFKDVAERHGSPPDFPSPEVGEKFLASLFADSQHVFTTVAEKEGRIVGSIFLLERSPIASIGVITIDPKAQRSSVGRQLMNAALEKVKKDRLPGVRLIQVAYNTVSFSLYSKVGFVVREPLACFQGLALNKSIPGHTVRKATGADISACNDLHFKIHGFMRDYELREAVQQGAAMVVERQGRITGYTTSVSFFGYTVGEANDDIKALIAAATAFAGPGFILPARNNELLLWCLANGLRIVQPMTMMSIGLYNEPAGAWLPSIFT